MTAVKKTQESTTNARHARNMRVEEGGKGENWSSASLTLNFPLKSFKVPTPVLLWLGSN